MPITQATKDLITRTMAEIDDIEFAALSQLLYESLLPANNKASSSELTTIGKQLYGGIPFKDLRAELKIPVMRSGAYLAKKLPDLFRVKEIQVEATPAEAAPAAPVNHTEEETRPETPEAKA
jgi:hypothetical protein